MNTVDRYLRQLRRHLQAVSGEEVEGAMAEIRGHLADHIKDLKQAGMNAQESEREAVRKMGSARRVSAGLVEASLRPLGKSAWTPAWVFSAGLALFFICALILTSLRSPSLLILYVSGRFWGPLFVVAITLHFRRRFGWQLAISVLSAVLAFWFIGSQPRERRHLISAFHEDYQRAITGRRPVARILPLGDKSQYWAPFPLEQPVGPSHFIPKVGVFVPFNYNVPRPPTKARHYTLLDARTEEVASQNWRAYGANILSEIETDEEEHLWSGLLTLVTFIPEIIYLCLWHWATYRLLVLMRARRGERFLRTV